MDITLAVGLVLLMTGCPRAHPGSDAGGAEANAFRSLGSTAGPQRVFVEIVGKRAALVAAGLQQIDLLFDEHSVTPLDGDRVRVAAYLDSEQIVDRIRSTGLTVRVLQTADQIREEEERIVRRLRARDVP